MTNNDQILPCITHTRNLCAIENMLEAFIKGLVEFTVYCPNAIPLRIINPELTFIQLPTFFELPFPKSLSTNPLKKSVKLILKDNTTPRYMKNPKKYFQI